MARKRITFDRLKDLAESVSVQSRVANRYWLAFLAISFFVISKNEVSGGNVSLPFDLGNVPGQYYSVVSFFMVCVMTIAFCSAYAQVHRVQNFAHEIMDEIAPEDMPFEHDSRDFFDFLRIPTVMRVSPLPQLAQGERQWFKNKNILSKKRLWFSLVYYIFVKTVAMLIYLGIPVCILIYVTIEFYTQESQVSSLLTVGYICVGVAGFSLMHIFVREVLHFIKVCHILAPSPWLSKQRSLKACLRYARMKKRQ